MTRKIGIIAHSNGGNALSAILLAGLSRIVLEDAPCEHEYDPWAERREKRKSIIFRQPALATFTSDRPLTKRQRRRMRGKGKP